MVDKFIQQDIDPIETQEWLDALHSLIKYEGLDRAQYILNKLAQEASHVGISSSLGMHSAYINTISPEQQEVYPDDNGYSERLMAFIRWNALAMVLRGGKKTSELGGHIASYASAALLYEIGFDQFFHGRTKDHLGDLIYIQGHSAPGIYARAFLEGRLTEKQLDHFRQEVGGHGLSSYPHPWLMPDFWQFPTVSMGLGALQAIYQAHFVKYLENRGFLENKQHRKIWMFCGDGEMDEVESLGALTLGSREKLDNLIFVINCNLQRLDGPVRGNGKIIEELEGVFRGAGWNVIKVLWGSKWDALFAKDKNGWLLKRIDECVDGEYQNYPSKGVAYFREHFFGKYPELAALVADMSDEELGQLIDGGHDPQKVYAAYAAAVKHTGQPTVILAKTVKGYGMGAAGEGLNVAHQQKKMATEEIRVFRDRFKIPVSDKELEHIPYYRPAKNSPEMQYLQQRRKELGGYLPARYSDAPKLTVPSLDAFASLLEQSEGREFSTTMAFVRILTILLKDKNIGKHVVPIVADESRTFGMEGLFRQVGIYSPVGQLYEPEDKKQLMYYREATDGQILQEGINEAGAFAAWIAAATSYSTNNVAMIPFYIFYSMFGFQRVGDLAWAAGDMRARGFLLGATAGRTTLAGEGLQHQDGHNILFFSTVPNCVCYDPTYAYEVAVIMQDGLRRMYQQQEDVYYYLALMNENYPHPEMPKDKSVREGIIKGMYLLKRRKANNKLVVQLLGAGTILREVEAAAEILEKDYDVVADVWSVTSFSELRKEAQEIERENNLHPKAKAKMSHVAKCLQEQPGPIIAASDYIRLYADQIRAFIPNKKYYVLGTDGFGRSDTRKKLRHFFEVDTKMIVYIALKALADEDKITLDQLAAAMKKLDIDPGKPYPAKM